MAEIIKVTMTFRGRELSCQYEASSLNQHEPFFGGCLVDQMKTIIAYSDGQEFINPAGFYTSPEHVFKFRTKEDASDFWGKEGGNNVG